MNNEGTFMEYLSHQNTVFPLSVITKGFLFSRLFENGWTFQNYQEKIQNVPTCKRIHAQIET